MFIVSRTFSITKGSASLLLERLNNDTQLTMAKGLISRSILLSQKVAEEEKVVVQLLWKVKKLILLSKQAQNTLPTIRPCRLDHLTF